MIEPLKVDKDILDKVKAAAVDSQQPNNAAQPPKKNNTNKKRKGWKTKRDSVDSKASSSAGLNELNIKRPEKKSSLESSNLITVSKKGKGHGLALAEGDKA
jgi:hypothetical protein